MRDLILGRYSYGIPIIREWGSPGQGDIKIGSFCSLAKNIKMYRDGNHRVDWISTYPFPIYFNEVNHIKDYVISDGNIVIGNDVWIGDDACILSGSIIEDGCVVGANTVVSGRIPAYSIVVGNPGEIIKKRFTDEQIEALLKIKWWEWSDEKIKENLNLFLSSNIQEFINKHLGEIK